MRVKRKRLGRKLYKWSIDKLEMGNQRQLREEMAGYAVELSELLDLVSTVDAEKKRNRAGPKVIG